MPNSVCSIPKIMGIMNVTPDSFYPKSRTFFEQSIDYTQYEYADIVDIGFESSRPGANPISEEDELNRLTNILIDMPNFHQTLSTHVGPTIDFEDFVYPSLSQCKEF